MNKLYLSCFSKRGRQTSLDTNFKWYFSPVESKAELQTRQVAVHPCAAAAKTCPGNRKKTKTQTVQATIFVFTKTNRGFLLVQQLEDGKMARQHHQHTAKRAVPWWRNSRLAPPPRLQPPAHVEVHLGWTKAPSPGESSQAWNLGSLTLTLANDSWTTTSRLHRSKKVSFLDDFPYPKSMKKWRNI